MSSLPPVKCLLVDDLQENLLALSALLQGENIELMTARSGPEALELALVHDFALAFLDVHMPDMDGFELAELLRGTERTRHVPLIFVTAGMREPQRVFKGYESGAVDFIYKPIEPHILKNKAEVFFQLFRQRQQLAHELQERTETLRLNELFTAWLAHDLRNPLTAILASAQLLQRRCDDKVAQDTAQRVISSGRRMSRMIEDIVDLARARLAGGIVIKREPNDFRSLLERVIKEHQAAVGESRIHASFIGDFAARCDGERMAQVASNLIGNALKHGQAGSPIEVGVDGTPRERLILTVSNLGVIPPEAREHLFDPFRGGTRQAGRSEGLGLGLYIVAQIVAAHGGQVDVESGGAGRTTFTVDIPRS